MSLKRTARIGEILLEQGHIHQEQVEEALELQRVRPKRLGQILLDLGYCEEDQVLEALSAQFGIPLDRDVTAQIDSSLTTKVPINFIREYRMVPYKKDGAVFCVALNDPVNLLPLDDLRLLLGGPVSPVL